MSTDETDDTTLPAYGMPVRSLANGEVDSDGYLRGNPADPPWNLFRIRGPLDTARLAAAVERVTLATDVLHLPLRATDHGPRLVRREPAPLKLEIVDVPATVADDRLTADAAAVLAPVLFDKPDLRHDPAGRICLIRATDGGSGEGGDSSERGKRGDSGERGESGEAAEQLLAVSVDHSVIDGWALGLLTRAIAGSYRSGDYTPRGRGFAAFVRDLPDERVRELSLTEWKGLLDRHPLPGLPLHLPGGGPVWPEPFQSDASSDGSLPTSLATDLTAAVARTGLSRAEVLTAATALAAGLWSDGPQPLLSLRHGHTRPEDVLVIGPLVEPVCCFPRAPSPRPSATGSPRTAVPTRHCHPRTAVPSARSLRWRHAMWG